MIYSIDFETRSKIDLKDRGLDIYANDSSTEVICIAFAHSIDQVNICEPNSPVVGHLLAHVRAGGKIQAWNAMFEYSIWNCVCVPKYGWPELKLDQCIDSMAIAAANNIPQSLDEAGTVMDAEYKKDPIGKLLIQKLCKPHKGVFNYDPDLLKQLFDYCVLDVKTEMTIVSKLRPLDAIEQKIWELTNRINILGVPVDVNEVENAVKAVKFAQNILDQELLALSGCKPSERQKLLNWLNLHGAKMENLTAESVTNKLQEPGLNSKVKQALLLRQEGSQTSVAKYAKILEIQRNGRIRNTLVYHGASTGRWASRGGLNLQNIARPTLNDTEIEDAIPTVFSQGIGSMRELSSLVRSAIKAPLGQIFVDVDFSSIENRVGVYLAGQKDKVEMFRQGLDEYKTFGSTSLFHVPYDEVTKDQRQIAKSAVLGCMFGQGAKGLVEYAKSMGTLMSLEQSQNAVDNYRAAYPRVKALWSTCEFAAIEAVQNPGSPIAAGSKLVLKFDGRALWMRLPSGRLICWQKPELKEVVTPWGQTKLAVTVISLNTFTRKWCRNVLIGSSIFQSATQGTARDFLAFSMLSLDKAGYPLVNSIHDEILALVLEEMRETALEDVTSIMTTPPSWALDFPLAAEGWVGFRYQK